MSIISPVPNGDDGLEAFQNTVRFLAKEWCNIGEHALRIKLAELLMPSFCSFEYDEIMLNLGKAKNGYLEHLEANARNKLGQHAAERASIIFRTEQQILKYPTIKKVAIMVTANIKFVQPDLKSHDR